MRSTVAGHQRPPPAGAAESFPVWRRIPSLTPARSTFDFQAVRIEPVALQHLPGFEHRALRACEIAFQKEGLEQRMDLDKEIEFRKIDLTISHRHL